jgi:dTDP-4-amino-4,6-dideoxygalactose transaminase|tara:strand:+ start:65 stop:1150 length:1086 start_codon:yes stop_codon:yes gene_type:complete
MNKLESFLTEYFDGHHCRLFARGSTGLYTLFRNLREIKGHGEVIIPGICCETVAMAAIYAGLKPVLADVEKDTLCLSYSTVKRLVSSKTRAIILVYIFGNLFNSAPFKELKDQYSLVLIEDLAQAVGGVDKDRKPGKSYDFTLLSFANDKIIKGGGGAIVQRSPEGADLLSLNGGLSYPFLDERVLQQKELSLRNLTHALYDLSREDAAIDISKAFRIMVSCYRDLLVRKGKPLEEISILKQFQRIEEEREKRYSKYLFYINHIKNDGLKIIKFSKNMMCWRMPVLTENPKDALCLTGLLRENNIDASNHYFPLEKLLYNSQYSNTTYIGSRIINLWVDDSVSLKQMKKTVELINSYRTIK